MRFTVDHIIPESLGSETVVENLCLVCWDFNLFKHNRIVGKDPETGEEVSLFHPRQQKWDEHFRRNIVLYRAGQITFGELDSSVQGWINHVRYGDTWGLRDYLFAGPGRLS